MNARDWVVALVGLIALLLFIAPGFGYECYSGGTGALSWWTLNDTGNDTCSTNDGTPANVDWEPAVWANGSYYDNNGDEVDVGDQASLENANGDISLCAWANRTGVSGANQFIATKWRGAADYEYAMFYKHADQDILVRVCDSAAANCANAQMAVNMAANTWYHICMTWDDATGNNTMYINGSVNVSAVNMAASLDNTAADFIIGAQDNAAPQTFRGVIDEVSFYNYTLTATEVNNLYEYNNVSGPPAPAGNVGCEVNLESPPDNDHTDDTTPLLTANLTCYQEMADRCYADFNGTQRGDNDTALANGSSFNITVNSSLADGYYDWAVNCTNTTYTNSSSSRGIYIDTTNPIVTITTPTDGQSFYLNASTNMSVLCQDTYAFNLSVDIYNGAGTLLNTYTNDSGSAPNFTLYDEFTSGLAEGQYYMNATCMDSHTSGKWKPDKVEVINGSMAIFKGGDMFNFSKNFSMGFGYQLLNDRVKWGMTAMCDPKGDMKVKFHVECSTRLYVINNSEYAGHFVCGEMWTDFQDLEDAGLDVKVVPEAWNSSEVEIEGEDVCTPNGTYYLDPATGGLNMGFALANFSIVERVDVVFNINADIATTGMWTDAYCSENTLERIYTRRACLDSACYDVNISEYEFCVFGCVNGSRTCRRSLIGENPIPVLLISCLAFLLVMIFIWRRWLK